MRSKVTKPYDYKLIPVPREMRLWRITDQELEEQLETLSHNHAYEADVDEVRVGDSVSCRGESAAARWNRPVLLFYPGRGICDEALESACVGAKLGERRTVTVEGDEITLTVTRIVRRSQMSVGDELIRAENIPGVETLEAYHRWYRETNEPTRALHASYRIALYLLHQFSAKSEHFIDEQEKDEWLWSRVDVVYKSMVAAGFDPTIPNEGFEFLTEEQARQNMYHEFEALFTEYISAIYIAESLSGRPFDEMYGERLEALAKEYQMTSEQLKAQTPESQIRAKIVGDIAMEELAKDYTQNLLED